MLQALLLNFCVLITLTYLLSLTYRTWPEPKDMRLNALRLGFSALMPLALLMSPATIAPGILADLRAVPVALVTLRYGPLVGLVATIPFLIYRTYLGGAGVISTYVSVFGVILLASVLQRRVNISNPGFDWRAYWGWLILIFLPNTLLLPVVARNPGLYLSVYLPVLVLDIVGFLIAHAMLLSRFRLLRLTSNLQVQANQDALTGLLNRRQFDAHLNALQPGDALLLLDIDHFKAVNDGYGHQVGDMVLSRVGLALASSLRGTDQAYRYGGEEFAVILRSPAAEGPLPALQIAERLRQHIQALPMPELKQQGVTVSVGVIEVGPGSDEPQALLYRADTALYQAKAQGRNRVQVWTEALTAGTHARN